MASGDGENWSAAIILNIPSRRRCRAVMVFVIALVAAGSGAAARRDQPLVIAGVAVGAGATPADFAEITEDCRQVVCRTNAKGEFRCRVAIPPTGAFCIEHPRLGRKRIELDGRRGIVQLGRVQLITGATVRVVRPPHVALPDGANVSLIQRNRQVAGEQEITSREIAEFPGLAAGDYAVLLAGPEILQRKLFPATVSQNGEAEVFLSLEAYRLTGEVEYDRKPLQATLALHGDAWTAELRCDAEGRFSAELWQPEGYAVSVEADELAAPYVVMKNASPSDSHWQFRIPSRRITGRVFDAETREPVPGVALRVNSDVDGTRATRPIAVKDDGTFELPGAGDGHYLITAHADGYPESDGVDLSVREFDGDQRVELPLWRGTVVDVVAMASDGRPLAGAVVLSEFGTAGMATRLQHTDADGRVSIAVTTEAHKPVFILPRDGSIAVATISPRTEQRVRVIVPRGHARLRLETRGEDGSPLAGIGFSLRFEGQELPQGVLRTFASLRGLSLVTDATGTLTLPGLPAGSYAIAWRDAGGALLPGGWTRFDLVTGETVIAQEFASGR